MKKKEFYFWRRFFAFLIDVIIISLLTSPLQKVIEKKVQLPANFSDFILFIMNPHALDNVKSFLFIMSLLIAFIALAYWTILEFTLKQSIGKMVFHLKVESKRVSQCIVRNLSKAMVFTNPFFFVFIMDILYSFFTKDHLRLFEKWSKTQVVKKE